MRMEIKELGHIVLYVHNIERSAAFYGDVLGWKRARSRRRSARWATCRSRSSAAAGPTTSCCSSRSGRTRKTCPRGRHVGLYHFGLKVGDSDDELRAAIRRCQEAGVTIVGASDHTVTHSLYITDPDGNEIELYIDVPGVSWDLEHVMAPVKALAL